MKLLNRTKNRTQFTCMLSNINILHSLHSTLLFLVLAGVTHSYSSRLFLCALGIQWSLFSPPPSHSNIETSSRSYRSPWPVKYYLSYLPKTFSDTAVGWVKWRQDDCLECLLSGIHVLTSFRCPVHGIRGAAVSSFGRQNATKRD